MPGLSWETATLGAFGGSPDRHLPRRHGTKSNELEMTLFHARRERWLAWRSVEIAAAPPTKELRPRLAVTPAAFIVRLEERAQWASLPMVSRL
jgi:hypothetical protein